MFKFRRKKHATSKPSSSPPRSNVDVMADDDDASSSSLSYDQTSPTYPTESSSSTFVTSGQERKTSSNLKGADDHDGGGVSTPSPPQPTHVLWDLIDYYKWDEASSRCRTHPQDARWCAAGGWLPIHLACMEGASLSIIQQLHEEYGEGVRMADLLGRLPLHIACQWNAALEVIKYLLEAYPRGVRTTNNYGWLPLHCACYNGSSLQVITYLHGLHPDGATIKDDDGDTPADLLKFNYELSWKDKAVARATLRGGRFRWPWSKPTPTPVGTTTMTLADVSTITTKPSKATAAASGGNTDHQGTPSAPTTATQPLTTLHEIDKSRTVSQRGDDALDDDERTNANAAGATACLTDIREKIKVSRSTNEVAATGDASGRGNEVIEQVETTDAESRSTAVAEAIAGVASRKPVEKETEGGHNDVDLSSSKERSERLVGDSGPDETAFRHATERLRTKGFYELHCPVQYNDRTGTQLISDEHSSPHSHRWEVHCLYDTLLVRSTESETVCDLKHVGYIAATHTDGSSTDSAGGETDSSGGGGNDRGGDSGRRTRTRRVRSAFRRLGIGSDMQDKKKLLVARYNYPHGGRGSATIFVRNERTDHEGKDVMKVKGIDLQTATVADLKSEIALEWHRDATHRDLCLLRENGAELCVADSILGDCDVVEGEMILLRQPRVSGKLRVAEQDFLQDWVTKTSPGREDPFSLHVVECEGRSADQDHLIDDSCTDNFRPELTIYFRSFYTPPNDNEAQSLLKVNVCSLSFGVKRKEGDGDGMVTKDSHRGFFVDKVQLSLRLPGDKFPTTITSPDYATAPIAYGRGRSRGVAVKGNISAVPSGNVTLKQENGTSVTTTVTPVHWWIRRNVTPKTWLFTRQTWNAPELDGGHTLYDVMEPREIRDFKFSSYSGHNQWLARKEIPDATTTFTLDDDLTATWVLKQDQDPFHEPRSEHLSINDRQARAAFTVKIVMGLCEIKIMTLPGSIRQRYDVAKRYREVVIDQEIPFAKIPAAPKTPPPRSRMVVAADTSDAATPAAKTMMEIIRDRRWAEVAKNVLRIDTSECAGLFFLACRLGPSIAAVQSFLQVDDTLPRKFNLNQELPIHILCRNGAEKGAIAALVGNYPQSIAAQSGISDETPLELAQSGEWIYYQDEQVDVISFLRRKSCAEHFDGMTGLPLTSGFDLWAHIKPPGLTNTNVVLLYIDMAGFTAVNNNVGHKEEGDRILKKCARDISRVCEVHADSMQSEFRVPHEVYRMGGDEFAVVFKFKYNPRTAWENFVEELATSLSELNYVDEQESPPRYSTFLRIGCAAGRLSKMETVLSIADKSQTALKKLIGIEKGACVPLSELRRQGKKNVSDLCVL